MDEDILNHLGITVGNVAGKVVEKYGTRKIGEPADAKNRKITRGVLAVVGIGLGVYGTQKRKKDPASVFYALTALGSSNLGELALGPENVLGITGKVWPMELNPTMPDITRLRSKIGQLAQEKSRLESENGQLRAKIGAMFPEETIEFSPSSTSAGPIGRSDDLMRAMGTEM